MKYWISVSAQVQYKYYSMVCIPHQDIMWPMHMLHQCSRVFIFVFLFILQISVCDIWYANNYAQLHLVYTYRNEGAFSVVLASSVCACVCTDACVCEHVYAHACVCMCVNVCACRCMYVHACACMCTYEHIWACMYASSMSCTFAIAC